MLKFLISACISTAVLAPATAWAVPVAKSAMAPLTFLTTADEEKIDGGAYCLAKYADRTIFLTDLSAAVVRFAPSPGQPSRMQLLDWIEVREGQPQLARSRNFRQGASNAFTVTIQNIPGAQSEQVSEEEWSTVSRLIVKTASGAVLGSLEVDWRCGA